MRVGIPGKTYTVPKEAVDPPRVAAVGVSLETIVHAWRMNGEFALERFNNGLRFDGRRREWVCRYGCSGGLTNVNGLIHHDSWCKHWVVIGDVPF